jgi:hypothetical protein
LLHNLNLSADIIPINNGLLEFFFFLELLFFQLFSPLFHVAEGFGDDVGIVV